MHDRAFPDRYETPFHGIRRLYYFWRTREFTSFLLSVAKFGRKKYSFGSSLVEDASRYVALLCSRKIGTGVGGKLEGWLAKSGGDSARERALERVTNGNKSFRADGSLSRLTPVSRAGNPE